MKKMKFESLNESKFKNFDTSSHLNLQKVLGGAIEKTTFNIGSENCCGTDTWDDSSGGTPHNNPDFKRLTEQECAPSTGLASGGTTSLVSTVGSVLSSSRI